jgi:hypothetical protein
MKQKVPGRSENPPRGSGTLQQLKTRVLGIQASNKAIVPRHFALSMSAELRHGKPPASSTTRLEKTQRVDRGTRRGSLATSSAAASAVNTPPAHWLLPLTARTTVRGGLLPLSTARGRLPRRSQPDPLHQSCRPPASRSPNGTAVKKGPKGTSFPPSRPPAQPSLAPLTLHFSEQTTALGGQPSPACCNHGRFTPSPAAAALVLGVFRPGQVTEPGIAAPLWRRPEMRYPLQA